MAAENSIQYSTLRLVDSLIHEECICNPWRVPYERWQAPQEAGPVKLLTGPCSTSHPLRVEHCRPRLDYREAGQCRGFDTVRLKYSRLKFTSYSLLIK